MEPIVLDSYVIDTLMPDLVGHDRQPSAFLVYLFLARQTERAGGAAVRLSLRALAEGTGLSKRSVQDALTRLTRRELVSVERESITAVPCYRVHRPWRGQGAARAGRAPGDGPAPAAACPGRRTSPAAPA